MLWSCALLKTTSTFMLCRGLAAAASQHGSAATGEDAPVPPAATALRFMDLPEELQAAVFKHTDCSTRSHALALCSYTSPLA